jgi:hypothetical protein
VNDSAIPILMAVVLAAIPVGAGMIYFMRRGLISSGGGTLHPLLILGIIFLFPGILNLILYGEESVFLSLGVIFTISGITSQLLRHTHPEDHARRYSLTGALLGFAIGAILGALLSLGFGWSPILMIVISGALGLLLGSLWGRFYRGGIEV